jgi:hypothetical protein
LGALGACVTTRPFVASISTSRAVGETVQMRVLVAFGDEHRAYREVIAAGIRILRPRTDVATATPAEIEGEIGRFDPQVVVCGQPYRTGVVQPSERCAIRPIYVLCLGFDTRGAIAARVGRGSSLILPPPR